MTSRFGFFVIFGMLLSLACGDGATDGGRDGGLSDGSVNGDGQSSRLSATVWAIGEGTLFPGGGDVSGQFLSFAEDQTGVMVYRHESTHALYCLDFFYMELAENMVLIDLEVFDEVSLFLPTTYLFAIEGETLTLTSMTGRNQSYTAAETLPEDRRCVKIADATFFRERYPAPRTDTGLVDDGTNLWFGHYVDSSDDQLYPVDPETGTVGAALNWVNDHARIHAFENGHFWSIGGHGNSVAFRREKANPASVTSINTDIDLGLADFSIHSMMWDGTHLWLQGKNGTSGDFELVKVDTGTPAIVGTPQPFKMSLQGMAWDGTHLWGVARESVSQIFRINPTTLKVIATYEIAGMEALLSRIRGIVCRGSDIFILYEEETFDKPATTIVRFTP